MANFYQPHITTEDRHFLDPEESRHCIKVLRYKTGDLISVLDGKGTLYTTRITEANPRQCKFEIVDHVLYEKPAFSIHLAVAPTKNIDRMEWFIEKVVEIGIQEISFLLCKNSERRTLKLDRLERKAVSAMKQSQNLYLPRINALTPFNQLIPKLPETQKFIAYVDFNNPAKLSEAVSGEQYCVLIGPEGDFTREEVDFAYRHGFKVVSLGKSRLRTETAGIVACHLLNLINGYNGQW